MTDVEPLFVDTNVLIYANVAGAPFHEQALTVLKTALQPFFGSPETIIKQLSMLMVFGERK